MKLRALSIALAGMLLPAIAFGQMDMAKVIHPDHTEFDAAIMAPFQSSDKAGAREIRLDFSFLDAKSRIAAQWRLELIAADGRAVTEWFGQTPLKSGMAREVIGWNGTDADGQTLPAGYYTLRLSAAPGPAVIDSAYIETAVNAALSGEEIHVQEQDIQIGVVPAASMPAFQALPVGRNAEKSRPATSSLPYTIYFGNFHAQTNHSDGGAAVGACGGSEVPQGGTVDPTGAYTMMRTQAGGDFMLASEHNHMYDGSTGTNSAANPTTANNLFASGKSQAAAFNSANPSFLALYGLEWGVISNGGHLNLVNPSGLVAWEKNASGQLIGQFEVAKNDYAALYTLMNAQGWVGQFNHPSTSQFAIGGTGMGYTANGGNVMVLAEILNSSAFSTNTSETETGRSTYPGAFNLLLERGFKVAPATNQDNHCANYGLSYRNRTGVLLPTGTTLNEANFVTALRARRVFAAEDKNGQLILTANGNLMGGTYSNSGALTLNALHASSNGQTVQRVQFFAGVPGRNGTVTQLTEGSGSYTFTPAAGAHFYYALVTQTNGDRFWSAPVWINQGTGGGDTTLPTASASVTGSSGTITLNATASDNIGVTSVEFLIDSVSRGSDTTSPYSLAFNSATLSNGTHSLVVKASDAAGNIGTSTAVSFTVSNTVSTTFTETESNGTAATGNVVGRSFTAIEGTMGNTTDKDFFAIALNANETLKVNMTGGPTGSDYDLYLVDSADATLVSSTGGTSTETVTYVNGASARTVYAKVISYAGSSTTVVYRLALTYTAGGSAAVEKVVNGGYESGASSWTDANSTITNSTSRPARTGSYKAWMCGYGAASNDTLYQTVTIPSTATEANYSFWTRIDSAETTTTSAYDTMRAEVRSSTGTLLTTLATYSNLNKSTSYVQRSFSLLAYKGQTVRLNFNCTEGSTLQTSFVIDDVSLLTR
ncbi:MAG TPA: Ig-like domain-containing protein [Xanthomonadales bacterium]|nr:Ig-like domain-containing protein [Xanthomonadales bacterium]